jgi:hypothetical protein
MRAIRCLLLIALCLTAFGAAAAQQPTTVVAVGLRSPDLTVKEMRYRVFYNRTEVKKIPLLDYDFKAALADELLNALAEDTRMQWRAQSGNEAIDVFAVQKKKAQLPPMEADRVLLVGVEDFGAFLADLAADKFYLEVKFKLIDRATGKKLWEKKLLVTEDLDGKLKDLQADNQKALKVGINKVLERVTRKMVADLRLARI